MVVIPGRNAPTSSTSTTSGRSRCTVSPSIAVVLFHGWFARPGPYTVLVAILGVAAVNTSLLFAPAALASLIVAGAVAWWRPRLPRLTYYWF
jgi:hypothetical protein